MSRKKKYILLGIITFSLLLVFMPNVFAAPTTQATEYVAENPCDENSIKTVLRIFGYLLMIARYLVPLIIIGFGTFDLFKSVVDKDEKSLGKQVKQLGIRVVTGLIVFFIPNIVSVFFSLSDTLNVIESSQYEKCAKCVLEPKSCDVQNN